MDNIIGTVIVFIGFLLAIIVSLKFHKRTKMSYVGIAFLVLSAIVLIVRFTAM